MKPKTYFYTPEEAAQIWRVDPETVRRWLRLGKIKGMKLTKRAWRIPAEVLFPKKEAA